MTGSVGVCDAARQIPAFAGMTKGVRDMTWEGAGVMWVMGAPACTGNNERGAGVTWVGSGYDVVWERERCGLGVGDDGGGASSVWVHGAHRGRVPVRVPRVRACGREQTERAHARISVRIL